MPSYAIILTLATWNGDFLACWKNLATKVAIFGQKLGDMGYQPSGNTAFKVQWKTKWTFQNLLNLLETFPPILEAELPDELKWLLWCRLAPRWRFELDEGSYGVPRSSPRSRRLLEDLVRPPEELFKEELTLRWPRPGRKSMKLEASSITLGSIFIFRSFFGDFFDCQRVVCHSIPRPRKITNMFVITSNREDCYAAPSTKLRN